MAEITDEQWDEILKNLESWSEGQLVKALTSHKFSEVYRRMFEHAQRAQVAEAERLKRLSKPELVDRAMRLVRQNNIFSAFVDCGGYSTVEFGNTRKQDNSNTGDHDEER